MTGECGEIQIIRDLVKMDNGIALSVRCSQQPRDRIVVLNASTTKYVTYASLSAPGVALSGRGPNGKLFIGQETDGCFGIVGVSDSQTPTPVVIQTPRGPLDLAAATSDKKHCPEHISARWPMIASNSDTFAFLITINSSGDPLPSRESTLYGLILTTNQAGFAAKALFNFFQPRDASIGSSGHLLAVSDLGASPAIHLVDVTAMVERTRFAGRYVSLSFSDDEQRIAAVEILDDGKEKLRVLRV